MSVGRERRMEAGLFFQKKRTPSVRSDCAELKVYVMVIGGNGKIPLFFSLDYSPR